MFAVPTHPRVQYRRSDSHILPRIVSATVAAESSQHGSQLMMAIAGGQPTFWSTAPASRMLTQEILESLATVEAGAGDQLAGLVARTVQHLQAGMRIIIISTRPSQWEHLVQYCKPASSPLTRSDQRLDLLRYHCLIDQNCR